MAGSGTSRVKGMATKAANKSVALSNKAPGGKLSIPTMSNRQYIAARAKADIAKVKAAVNSPTGKAIQRGAVGFGKGVAAASKGSIAAGKAARALFNKLK